MRRRLSTPIAPPILRIAREARCLSRSSSPSAGGTNRICQRLWRKHDVISREQKFNDQSEDEEVLASGKKKTKQAKLCLCNGEGIKGKS